MDVRIPSLAIPQYVVQSKLHPTAKLVFAAIYTSIAPAGELTLTYGELARAVALPERTVYRAVKELEAAELIDRETFKGRGYTSFWLGKAARHWR